MPFVLLDLGSSELAGRKLNGPAMCAVVRRGAVVERAREVNGADRMARWRRNALDSIVVCDV